MENQQWECQKCGRVGGFILMGGGFIMCSVCGTWHVVTASGLVHRVGRSTPELLPFCHTQSFHIEVLK